MKERISLCNLEKLDAYDSSNNQKLSNDNCDFIDYENCIDIDQGPADLSILEINIRGLVNKQHDLLLLLRSITRLNQVDVVILVETWLTKESESHIKIPGYDYYGMCRQHKKGGGVGFLVRHGINYKTRPDLIVSSNVLENCFIELVGLKRNILIGSLYRAPNLNPNIFVQDYITICKRLQKEKAKDSIIGLDHNMDFLKHHLHKQTQNFMEAILEYAHFPCITRPTRITNSTATLIDNILLSCNLIGKQNSCIIINDLSDHLPCMTVIRECKIIKKSVHECYKRTFSSKCVENISQKLSYVDWDTALEGKNTTESLDHLYDVLGPILDKEAPEKLVRVSTSQVISLAWMTPGLLRSSKRQLLLYKKSLTSRNNVDVLKYKNYRNILTKLKRACKMSYYVQKCNEFRNDSKKLWGMINNIVGKANDKKGVIEKLSVNNIETSNAEIIVNHFGQHFASVGKRFASEITTSKNSTKYYLSKISRNTKSMFLTPVTQTELELIIDKLPNKISSGWDDLSNKIIKKLKGSLLYPLAIIVNRSLTEGVFPDNMKIANVTPLFKNGKKIFCTNYRPISLLPVLSKILEKVMYSRTYRFLQSTDQLYNSQYGFRQRHSCENAIQELLSNVLKGHENKKFTAAIYLDLSKAFDTLRHDILLKKLEIYGIRGIALDWFKHYLKNRVLRVKCTAGDPPVLVTSKSYSVDYGVPQGSCLGPLLFLIYCNDLPLNLDFCKSILFADDTTLYKSHENLVYLKWCLQEELNNIMDWFKANKLTLNLNKSTCMLFGDKKVESFSIEVDDVKLTTVSSTKFLGVWIDNKLSWNFHVKKLLLKIKRNVHLLRTGKRMLNVHAKKLVYFAHIQSHLTYCLTVWGNMVCTSQLKKLEGVQEKCADLIRKGSKPADHGILTVRQLIELENCKFGYKLINGDLPTAIVKCTLTDTKGGSLLKTHQYNTRTKNIPNVPNVSNSKYLKSVLCMGPKAYSTLEHVIKNCKSIGSFVKRVKSKLLSQVKCNLTS